MRILDLFCGAGGAAAGYHRAGFDVVGVDISPQPRYPYKFYQADALEFLEKDMKVASMLRVQQPWDAIHASPPCQSYSRSMKHLAAPQPMLIEPLRELLERTHLPYVIENVEGAPLNDPLMLCGSMFGYDVWRHRLFETNFPVTPLEHRHQRYPMNPHNVDGRRRMRERYGTAAESFWAREGMGIGWMTQAEAREAIPPYYTTYVGLHLRASLMRFCGEWEAA